MDQGRLVPPIADSLSQPMSESWQEQARASLQLLASAPLRPADKIALLQGWLGTIGASPPTAET